MWTNRAGIHFRHTLSFDHLLHMRHPHVTTAAWKTCMTWTPPLVLGEVGYVIPFFELWKALLDEHEHETSTHAKQFGLCVSVLLPGFVISSSHERGHNELQCYSIKKCRLLKSEHTLNTICIWNCLQFMSQSPHALPSPAIYHASTSRWKVCSFDKTLTTRHHLYRKTHVGIQRRFATRSATLTWRAGLHNAFSWQSKQEALTHRRGTSMRGNSSVHIELRLLWNMPGWEEPSIITSSSIYPSNNLEPQKHSSGDREPRRTSS